MHSTLGKMIAAGALAGALAIASTVPSQAAQGRNAAFAAGVGVGLLGGAALGGGYGAYPAYGGYGYGSPRYAYGAYGGGWHRHYDRRGYHHR